MSAVNFSKRNTNICSHSLMWYVQISEQTATLYCTI